MSHDLDMTVVTQRYFPDFEDPSIINTGWCYVWAWMAWLHFVDDGVRLAGWSTAVSKTPGDYGHLHALIVRDDGRRRRYYDSSCPTGTRQLRDLSFFRDNSYRANRLGLNVQTPQQFERWWRLVGSKAYWKDQRLPQFPKAVPTPRLSLPQKAALLRIEDPLWSAPRDGRREHGLHRSLISLQKQKLVTYNSLGWRPTDAGHDIIRRHLKVEVRNNTRLLNAAYR